MRLWYLNLRLPTDSLRNRFILAMLLSGPTVSALRFAEVIARKSLDATVLEVTLLTMIMPVTSFSALWVGRLLEGRDQRPFLLAAGVVGSFALGAGLLVHSVGQMIAVLVVFYLFYVVQMTGQNRVLQQHVQAGKTGGVFGMSNGIREAVAGVTALLAGLYMDHFANGYRHFFLIAGVFYLLTTLVFAAMPTRAEAKEWRPPDLRRTIAGPLIEVGRLLKRRKDFLRFEIGFMIYGLAFMMTLPVIPIFLVDLLALDYATIGMARGTVFQLTMIPSIAIFGGLFDRVGPHRLAAGVFGMLAVFPVLLIASWLFREFTLPLVFVAFVAFGAAMGGVAVLWNIASVRFAGDEDAGVYQSLHIAATGIRGLFAPLLGYLVMNRFGALTALSIAAGVWVIAAVYMRLLERRDGRLA